MPLPSHLICLWRPANEIILYPRHPKETVVSNKAIPILAVIVLLGGASAWYWAARISPTVPLEQVGSPAPSQAAPPPSMSMGSPEAGLPRAGRQ